MTDVAVVGAGIAGLSVGYELQKRGVSFVVLERAARAGGVIWNEQVDGFTIDAGPDALLAQKPDAISLCEELGLGTRLMATKPPRIAYVQRDGRLHPLPAGSVLGIPTALAPFVTSRLFSWPGKLRMGAELFARRRGSGADESIAGFIGRHFGAEAVTYLAEPLLAGIHAGDVGRLSVNALFPRLTDAERTHGSLIRAFRQTARRAGSSAFRSLPGGLSEMVAALVARLPAGTLQLTAGVMMVSARSGRFAVKTSSGLELTARAVVLSTPAHVTGELIGRLDDDLARLCLEIPYVSTATVVLGFARADIRHPLTGSGFVVPGVEGTGILAASFLSSKWPHRAPDGRVLLRAFAGGARDPGALARTDAELIDQALGALTPLIGIRGRPLLARVYRFPRASPQHEVGHAARLAAIERALGRHPGLFVTGGGFRGVGISDCIADGRATAATVKAYLDQHM